MVLFPYWNLSLSIGPCSSFHGLGIFSTKVLLRYLSLTDSFLSCSSKLPVGSRSCWTPRYLTGRLVCQNRSNTLLCQCTHSVSPCHCKLKAHPLLYLETYSFSQFSLLLDSFGFLRRISPSPLRPLRTVLTLLPRSQPSFVLLSMQNKPEEEFFLQRYQSLTAESIVPHLSGSSAPFLAVLLPYLISDPDHGAWPDCWVSAKFLRVPKPRKEVG